jgi:hypothetical protein
VPVGLAKLALSAVGLLFVLAIAFGAWTGFPVYNDAYFVGFIRELGAGSILADHPDQPLSAFLLQLSAKAFGWSRAPHVAISLAFWILLAWQTVLLWKKLFPEEPALGALTALLVLSPILVETQYTTITAILRANLPVSLCLAALLICLRSREQDRWALVLSATLIALAAAQTEYGVATMAASVALLLPLRRFRAAGALLAGGAGGYLVFRLVSNVRAEKYVDPSYLLPRVLDAPGTAVARWINGLWHCLAGAWLSAAGALRIEPGSRSTWLAAAVGLFSAAALAWALRSPRRTVEGHVGGEEPRRSLAALFLAVAVGLIPVILANRAPDKPASDSRHRTHVLPFAAVAVVALASRIPAPRYRQGAFAFLAFLAGYWVVEGAFKTRHEQRLLEDVGARLLPLVRASPGITVAVLPGRVARTDWAPKATIRWSDEEAKRAWVLLPDEAVTLFGPRVACRDTSRIDTPPELHSTGRHGPLSHLVWVSVVSGAVESIEPYCVGPVRTGA